MLKVAIDGGPLASGDSIRGIGVYVRELTKFSKGADIVDISKTDLFRYDVIHLTRFNPFRLSVPFSKPNGTKFILTIYDLIPLIYPASYPPGIKGRVKWLLNKYLIHKNIDAIITISETSKKDICRFLGVAPDMVLVTYLGPKTGYTKLEAGSWKKEITEHYNLPGNFALYVGDVNYNKNIPNLVKACKVAKIPLVLSGKQGKEIDGTDLNHAELKHLKGIDWSGVIKLGYVPDTDLVKIYNLATLYIQPSFYEGFGLPLLEALACGTPVSVSKNQCHVEILGPDFEYFDPNDIESIVRGLLNPNKGKKLPRNYSWEKTAEKTRSLYEKI
jgi:glycosyltransferase involved in cell wall biosynthesis